VVTAVVREQGGFAVSRRHKIANHARRDRRLQRAATSAAGRARHHPRTAAFAGVRVGQVELADQLASALDAENSTPFPPNWSLRMVNTWRGGSTV
jgi:hypothetical protein